MASLSQGRTAAAQCGLFTHKSVPVIFEPPCICRGKYPAKAIVMLKSASDFGRFTSVKLPTASLTVDIEEDARWVAETVWTSRSRRRIFSLLGTEHRFLGFAASSPVNIRCSDAHLVRLREIFQFYRRNLLNISRNETYCEVVEDKRSNVLYPRRIRKYGVCMDN